MINELVKDIAFQLLDLFEHNIIVKVNNQKTVELYNFDYILKVDEIQEFLKEDYKPNSIEDVNERKKIIEYFVNCFYNLKIENIHTRQLVYQPKYEGNEKLAACLSCIQVIIRDDQIDIHVFVRSQNFDNNFLYDNLTYCLLMLEMYKRFEALKMGHIFVKIVSLHKIIK